MLSCQHRNLCPFQDILLRLGIIGRVDYCAQRINLDVHIREGAHARPTAIEKKTDSAKYSIKSYFTLKCIILM